MTARPTSPISECVLAIREEQASGALRKDQTNYYCLKWHKGRAGCPGARWRAHHRRGDYGALLRRFSNAFAFGKNGATLSTIGVIQLGSLRL